MKINDDTQVPVVVEASDEMDAILRAGVKVGILYPCKDVSNIVVVATRSELEWAMA